MRAVLDWDRHITRLDVDDELDVTITSTLSAIGDVLPPITARTTLRLNPCVPAEEDDDGILPAEVNDLIQAFLNALPPAVEQARGTSAKTAASKTKQTTKGNAPSKSATPAKGRRK
jgi:hypothetical protein